MAIIYTATDAQVAAPGFASGSFTINIGTPSADRIVLVGYVDNSTGVSVPTLNGTAMTLAAGGTTFQQMYLYYASVSTGTTATLGYSGGSSAVSIVVSTISGQSGSASATPTNTAVYTSGGAQPLSLSLTVPSGGLGFIVSGSAFGPAGTFTWTGTTSSSGDRTTGNANNQNGSASSLSTGTVTVSSTSSLSFGGTMAAASWAAATTASVVLLSQACF